MLSIQRCPKVLIETKKVILVILKSFLLLQFHKRNSKTQKVCKFCKNEKSKSIENRFFPTPRKKLFLLLKVGQTFIFNKKLAQTLLKKSTTCLVTSFCQKNGYKLKSQELWNFRIMVEIANVIIPFLSQSSFS